MVAKKFPGRKGKGPVCLFNQGGSAPGGLLVVDRELVRVILGLMNAVYGPAGILTAVRVFELVRGCS